MKKFALAFVAGISLVSAKAQKFEGFKFGAGIEAALPLGDFKKSNSFGIGAQLQGEYALTDYLTGIATTGYTNYFGKTFTQTYSVGGTTYSQSVKSSNVGHIPILVGVRFYPSESVFVGAQIGYGIFTGGGGASSPKGFEYRPQIGYSMENFQLALSYDGVSVTGGTLSHLGLTGIYIFGGQ
jgi:hypothetical protein